MTQPLAEKTAYKQVYSVLRDTMPMFIGGIQKQKSQKISKGLSAKKHEKFEILKIWVWNLFLLICAMFHKPKLSYRVKWYGG